MSSICIVGAQEPRGYSGGRYHAVTAAIALAESGWQVTMWSDNKPIFWDDFSDYAGQERVFWHLDRSGFRAPPEGCYDHLLIIPDRKGRYGRYGRWISFGLQRRIAVSLLNFETPNWFSGASKNAPPPHLWAGWDFTSRFARGIISSTRLGDSFARDHYRRVNPNVVFASCSPAINSKTAERCLSLFKKSPRVDSEPSIVAITRFSKDLHKGAQDIYNVIGPEFAEASLIIIADPSKAQPGVVERLRQKAHACRIELKFASNVSDYEKFKLLAKASALVFLSEFEGFGYPPVEATYIGTPCVTFDLPVVRETCGSWPIYVTLGDYESVRQALSLVLSDSSSDARPPLCQARRTATIDTFGRQLTEVLEQVGKAHSNCPQTVVSDCEIRRWCLAATLRHYCNSLHRRMLKV